MTSPLSIGDLDPIPHGRTARRLTWEYLPPGTRKLIETHLGARVARASSRDSGFTPGFASVLTGADGSRIFVKAASRVAQAQVATSYAEEARKLGMLGDGIPAPRLLWVHQDEAWVVLGFEAVEGHQPARPWQPAELDRALDLAEAVALIDVPAKLALTPLTEDLPTLLTGWSSVPDDWPHHRDAAALARSLTDVPDGDRFVHADLRDDNVLLLDDGRTLACDWNWPALGPAWLDLVVLLVSAHGDGLDADAALAERRLTADVDADYIDAWLAALCGFMLESRSRRAPANSPFLRAHAAWYAAASWSWLSRRRGWIPR